MWEKNVKKWGIGSFLPKRGLDRVKIRGDGENCGNVVLPGHYII